MYVFFCHISTVRVYPKNTRVRRIVCMLYVYSPNKKFRRFKLVCMGFLCVCVRTWVCMCQCISRSRSTPTGTCCAFINESRNKNNTKNKNRIITLSENRQHKQVGVVIAIPGLALWCSLQYVRTCTYISVAVCTVAAAALQQPRSEQRNSNGRTSTTYQ